MTTEGLIRHTGVVTSLSWIPTEAIQGAQRLAFDSGITHYDPPPPTEAMDVERLRDEDRFRFANELRAFVTVNDGRIVDCGYEGGGLMGTTLVNLGAVRHRFQAVQLPDIQRAPEMGRWLGQIRADVRRSYRRPGATTSTPPPLRPMAGTVGVDHAVVDTPCRRTIGASLDRSQPVPPPLGLRRRSRALAQVGSDGLQGLVPQIVRQAQPVGRRGLRGPWYPPSSRRSRRHCRRS